MGGGFSRVRGIINYKKLKVGIGLYETIWVG